MKDNVCIPIYSDYHQTWILMTHVARPISPWARSIDPPASWEYLPTRVRPWGSVIAARCRTQICCSLEATIMQCINVAETACCEFNRMHDQHPCTRHSTVDRSSQPCAKGKCKYRVVTWPGAELVYWRYSEGLLELDDLIRVRGSIASLQLDLKQ